MVEKIFHYYYYYYYLYTIFTLYYVFDTSEEKILAIMISVRLLIAWFEANGCSCSSQWAKIRKKCRRSLKWEKIISKSWFWTLWYFLTTICTSSQCIYCTIFFFFSHLGFLWLLYTATIVLQPRYILYLSTYEQYMSCSIFQDGYSISDFEGIYTFLCQHICMSYIT